MKEHRPRLRDVAGLAREDAEHWGRFAVERRETRRISVRREESEPR